MKRSFIIEVDIPPNVTVAQMKEYIVSAVQCECGQRHPDDPLHSLDRDKVRIVASWVQ